MTNRTLIAHPQCSQPGQTVGARGQGGPEWRQCLLDKTGLPCSGMLTLDLASQHPSMEEQGLVSPWLLGEGE